MYENDRTVGAATLAGALALIAVGAIAGLSPTGAGLTFIGVTRMCFLAGLLALSNVWNLQAAPSRLRSIGTTLAVVGAPMSLFAAIAHGLIGGWDFDPFEGTDAAPPWYSVLVGLGALAFAAGCVLVGVPHLRDSRTRAHAMLLIGAGLLYLPAIPLGAVGHAIWALPWLGLGAVLISNRATSAMRSQAPIASGP